MTTTQYVSAIDAAREAHRARRPTSEDLVMMERTRGARDVLSAKWKVDLLYLLARGVRRYSRLYDNLRGASKKMLTDSLRSLERDGFVERYVYAEVPVRVEYSLTPLGWSATGLLMALADWADVHMLDVEEARRRYDALRRRATVAPIPIGYTLHEVFNGGGNPYGTPYTSDRPIDGQTDEQTLTVARAQGARLARIAGVIGAVRADGLLAAASGEISPTNGKG